MSQTTTTLSLEVRERAARLDLGNEGQHGLRWQAVLSIAAQTGCAPQILNAWIKQGMTGSSRPGSTAASGRASRRRWPGG